MQICVYGASSSQIDAVYLQEAQKLGALMAKRGHTLIFGGGANGVMGAAARGVFAEGGKIVGVAPSFFNVDGVLFPNCTEFIYTETMRERKQIMDDRADAFVLAPGGFGSFEEFFEILTLKQLGRHNRPIAVLNTNGYYGALQAMVDVCIEQKFAKPACLELYRLCDTPQAVLEYLQTDHTAQKDVRDLKAISL